MKRIDTDQISFQRFARHLRDGFSKVVVWAGAGVSKPAKCPSWPELLTFTRDKAVVKTQSLDALAGKLATSLIEKADSTGNYWEKFSLLKRALNESTYPMVIREAFANQDKIPPRFYGEMWKLGIQGFITTNLDRFAVRAAGMPGFAGEVIEFESRDSADYSFLLRTEQQFVVNVHGRLDVESSWILTAEDLSNLMHLPEYWALLESWLREKVVLFAGCSPDDVSVAAHLAKLKSSRLRLEAHFWLTHRNDQAADDWAEKHGLSRIHFDANDGSFDGVDQFLNELRRFTSPEEPPPIVVPIITAAPATTIKPPGELLVEPSVNNLRATLNVEACRILTSGKPVAEIEAEYGKFFSDYEEVLHRAWFISTNKGAEFFDLYINEVLKKGAFGQVYDAIDPLGNHVALKVLHGNVKDDPAMLTCFRRGVEAMRLLTKYHVDGVVPYLRAWEIPTCAVMELIDGVNLQEAVERHQLDSWLEILRVAHSLSSIIKQAHSTPAGVLHRDLRPANIMLEGKEDSPGRKVLVLDFDLCWHQDVAEGTTLRLDAEQNNGYLAPEQLDPSRHNLTRKPLVDSFGMGMILYYLVARKHPEINQYMFKGWEQTLGAIAMDRPCREWRSVPRRFSRVILNSTMHEQAARWDMSKINVELSLLFDLVSERRRNVTAELLAEELMCRASAKLGSYNWLAATASGILELREGFTFQLKSNEREKRVLLHIQWLQTGSYRFEAIKKYSIEAADAVSKALREGGWFDVKHSLSTGNLMFDAVITTGVAEEESFTDAAAMALVAAMEPLRMLSNKAQ